MQSGCTRAPAEEWWTEGETMKVKTSLKAGDAPHLGTKAVDTVVDTPKDP